jgi:homoserine dehydrogenase
MMGLSSMLAEKMRIAVLGIGSIGRELLKRTMWDTSFSYIALGDTSGVIFREDGFTRKELDKIIKLKECGGSLKDFKDDIEHTGSIEDIFGKIVLDTFVDVTASQTYDLIHEALGHAHVITANKIPLADVSFQKFEALFLRARNEERKLDYGTTVGAGMRIPDVIKGIGSDGVNKLTGCLSGTMNYVSQRLNEGQFFSTAIREAMEPTRRYTEPDPRIDIGGMDFARKLVILSRICGKPVEIGMIDIEDLLPAHLKHMSLKGFLDNLEDLDSDMRKRFDQVKKKRKVSWFIGTADLKNERYSIGFEDLSKGDPITKAKESDNVFKFLPRGWRRSVTLIGPGAGPTETVTGLTHGLHIILNALQSTNNQKLKKISNNLSIRKGNYPKQLLY